MYSNQNETGFTYTKPHISNAVHGKQKEINQTRTSRSRDHKSFSRSQLRELDQNMIIV